MPKPIGHPSPTRMNAMITSVEFKNFKSIRALSFDLPKLAVLVGPNGSGKTNIVQAMELFGEILARGTTDPARERGWTNILRRAKRPARGGITLGVKVEHAGQSYSRAGNGRAILVLGRNVPVSLTARLTLGESKGNDDVVVLGEELIAETRKGRLRIAVAGLDWNVDAGTDPTLWRLFRRPVPVPGGRGHPVRPPSWDSREDATQAILQVFTYPGLATAETEEGLPGDDSDHTVLRILNRVRFEMPCIHHLSRSSQIDRFRLDSSALRSDAPSREATTGLLGSSGEGLANAIDLLRGRGKEPSLAFRRVLGALQKVYPRIEDVRAQRIQPGRLTLLFRERGIQEDLGLTNVSDGVLHALALLVMLEGSDRRPSSGLLAIEEPENAIHPWSVRSMVDRAQASSRQVLITTHSETVVNAVQDPASLFIVENDDQKGTMVTRARDKERALDVILSETGQRLGDVWMDGSLGGVPDL